MRVDVRVPHKLLVAESCLSLYSFVFWITQSRRCSYTQTVYNHPNRPLNVRCTNFWVVEEIQSDLFGKSTKLADLASSRVDAIAEKFSEENRKHLEDFWVENFKDWDMKLMSSLISMARKEDIDTIWILVLHFFHMFIFNLNPSFMSLVNFLVSGSYTIKTSLILNGLDFVISSLAESGPPYCISSGR